jgi:DNA-binding MarR family transcriptional regulator
LRAFQTIDTEFPIQYAICFLEISLQEGISLTTLSKRTGMAMSTTSRIIGALSNNRQKGKAFALVYAEISPQERRKKEIYLTERGHQLIKDMSNLYA